VSKESRRDSETKKLTTKHSILKKLGIPVKVNLPGVGENFQEQGNNALVYSGTPEATGGVAVSQTFASPADLFGSNLGEITRSTRKDLPRWADLIVSASGSASVLLNKTAVEKVLQVQHDLVFGKRATTLAEYVTQTVGDGVLISSFWPLYSFSRGSVHLTSADVSKINLPRIDPRLNLVDFDLAIQIRVAKLAERLWRTTPLSPLVSGRVFPGLDVLPADATEAQWREFVKTTSEF